MASESDQTLPLPLPPLPAPSNPNQIHTTPTAPDPTPPASSAARKLPIKRRSPPRPSTTSPSSSGPASSNPNPNPNPAFKFQRIWSETDELRLLQGLLGCGPQGQGLLFPRDLNVFYDQFSESMPQPYTRSQLSEKLRRLRNKHRAVAARVAKGLDPARLAPHDRDVLHLCSRLWDPAYAANSPFAGPDCANKRRRANPNTQGGLSPLPAPSGDSSYNGGNTSSAAAPGATFPDENDGMYLEQESGHNHLYFDNQAAPLAAHPTLDGLPMSQPGETAAAFADNAAAAAAFTNIADNQTTAAAFTNAPDNGAVAPAVPHIFADNNNTVPHNGNSKAPPPRSDEHRVASAVLDIFEECMREAKAQGTVCEAEESELAKRWRQQRIDELDVLSRRLRLMIEDSTTAAAGH